MKLKKEYIIAAVLIAASILYLVLQRDSRVNYQVPELADLDRDSVTAIQIDGSEETIELNRNGDVWTLGPEEYKADQNLVQSLLSSLDFTIQDLITERSDYDRYNLQDGKAIRVTLLAGDKKVREFLMGKKSSSGVYTYIRLPGHKGIYSVQKDLTEKVKTRKIDWQDKQVMNFAPDDTEKIQITGSSEITLTKIEKEEGTFWSRDGKTPAEDSEDIDRQVETLSTLKATGFTDRNETAQPQATVIITAASGVHELMVFEKQESGYRVRSSDGKGEYIIPAFAGDAILDLIR